MWYVGRGNGGWEGRGGGGKKREGRDIVFDIHMISDISQNIVMRSLLDAS